VFSLDIMHFRDGHLEVSNADFVITSLSIFFSTVIHSIEFTNFVTIPDFLKHCLYLQSSSKCSEILFFDSNLTVIRRKKKINSFWFIAIVLVISYTLEVFIWNIFSDSWASKASVYIFFFSYNISAVWFYWFSQIFVW